MRIAAPLVLAAALTFTLTGCFGNPVENLVEGVIEDQTGIDVDVSSDGSSVSLPDGWPAEVPVPDGTIVSAFSAGETYSVSITVADEAAALAGVEAIKAAGFEVEVESDMGELKSYVLFSETLSVTYAVLNDSGAYSVTMSATPRG